jgi:hypothetical protein
MSFTRFVESKKRPTVELSLAHYRDVLEREVYDSLLDPFKRDECFLTHLAEIMDLRPNLVRLSYPRTEELLMAIAAREPSKIRRAHEQFVAWGKGKDPDRVASVENSLFECRSYLYGKEVEFSKEVADKIVESVCKDTENNALRIVRLLETAINRVHNWHNSTVIFQPLKPDAAMVSNEGMVVVGQPPSMTFMCNNKPLGIEVYDIQDVDGYPISIQEDYTGLVRALQVTKPRSAFQTLFVMAHPKDRQKYEQIKREISLGMEATLPTGSVLQESPPDHPEMDIWRVKLKNNKIINESSEAPIRWLDLYKKAE